MKFLDMVALISEVDGASRLAAGRSMQQILSLRNWIIGASIIEFEQAGEDRARYGQRLMPKIANALAGAGCQGLSSRNLHNFRQLALAYPGLDAVGLGRGLAFPGIRILQAPAESDSDGSILQAPAKSQPSPFPSLASRAMGQEQLPWRDSEWLTRLFTELTFTHLLEMARIDDLPQRAFYELHCLKERWATRELVRQRESMLYERIGLSESRDEVLALAREGRLAETPSAQLKDLYVFEFLGIERRSVMTESDLEQALIDHLRQFLLELGRDFCFVDRQFRITAGNRHHHLDLLFFHRGLRCLVAIDLKLGEFKPEHAGQLRFYVNYLAEQVAHPNENPPVGILLCAERDAEVVRFATAGDEDLFVTRYQLELPSEEQLQRWLHEERARIEHAQEDPGEGQDSSGDDD
jgi:predicted nuclease of restriction endonuclease-like (RecB) superfamily